MSHALHALITCIARAVAGEQRQAAVRRGLPPVQGAILAYLRDANRYSNTPQALADFLNMTKGTVSQSIKRLESGGLIERTADAADRRIVRLALTDNGRALLDDAWEDDWRKAIDALPAADRITAERALSALLAGWQVSRFGRTFGVCRTCAHFERGQPDNRCGLTGEPLSDHDSLRICREHRER